MEMKPRHNKNSSRPVSVRGYAGFLILLSAPFLLGAGDNDRTASEENRQQIRKMTSTQQAKLQRNFAEFQKLSVEDQNVIRKLHQRLEEDANKGGNLNEMMLVYKEWLKTLSPWQREELLKQKDPLARLELVRKFKQQQELAELERTLSPSKKEQLRKADPATREKLIREFKRDPETMSRRSSLGFSRRGFRPLFSTAEFDNIMSLVEENTVTDDEDLHARLASATKIERHLLVLLAALKQSQKQQTPQIGDPKNSKSQRPLPVSWPDDALMEKLMVMTGNSEFQKRLGTIESPEGRRRHLFFSITGSFNSEWWAELRQNSPSDEELQKFFKQIDQFDKDDLLRLSGSDQSRRLKNLYYRQQGTQSDFHDDYLEFQKITGRDLRFGSRGGSRSRGGGRGPGDRGRSRGGSKGEFAPGKRPPFRPGDKDSQKRPPRG